MNAAARPDRNRMIAEAAYYRAQQRGFRAGNPMDDWLAAEAEIDQLLSQEGDVSEQLEDRLASLNRELKAFRQKLLAMEGAARQEFEQSLKALTRLRDRFRKRVRAMRDSGENAIDESRERIEHLWQDIAEMAGQMRDR